MYGSLIRTPIDVASDFPACANFGCTAKSNRPAEMDKIHAYIYNTRVPVIIIIGYSCKYEYVEK